MKGDTGNIESSIAGYAHQELPSLPGDDHRMALFLAMLEINRLFRAEVVGGVAGMLVCMTVNYGSIVGEPVNVSTIADTIGMDRKTVRKVLKQLEEAGFIQREAGVNGYSTYTRNMDPEIQLRVAWIVDRIYEILAHRLGDKCEKLHSRQELIKHKATHRRDGYDEE